MRCILFLTWILCVWLLLKYIQRCVMIVCILPKFETDYIIILWHNVSLIFRYNGILDEYCVSGPRTNFSILQLVVCRNVARYLRALHAYWSGPTPRGFFVSDGCHLNSLAANTINYFFTSFDFSSYFRLEYKIPKKI